MQEKKVWTLVALAMLTALTLVRPEPQLDGRAASRPEEDAIVPSSSAASTSPHAGSAWLLFRADWGGVLRRVYQKMNDNRLLAVAAGVVFLWVTRGVSSHYAFVSFYGLTSHRTS